MDEAIHFINERPNPLAAYIFSKHGDVIAKFRDRVLAGGTTSVREESERGERERERERERRERERKKGRDREKERGESPNTFFKGMCANDTVMHLAVPDLPFGIFSFCLCISNLSPRQPNGCFRWSRG